MLCNSDIEVHHHCIAISTSKFVQTYKIIPFFDFFSLIIYDSCQRVSYIWKSQLFVRVKVFFQGKIARNDGRDFCCQLPIILLGLIFRIKLEWPA